MSELDELGEQIRGLAYLAEAYGCTLEEANRRMIEAGKGMCDMIKAFLVQMPHPYGLSSDHGFSLRSKRRRTRRRRRIQRGRG